MSRYDSAIKRVAQCLAVRATAVTHLPVSTTRRWLRTLVAGAAFLGSGCAAAVPEATEYDVKAAFIYNFARFTEWPSGAFEHPTDPIRICIIGDDPFGNTLEDIVRGKMLAQHSLVVARVGTPAGARDCHIAFVGRADDERLGSVIAAVRDRPVMTIGDTEYAAQRGAVLGFLIQNGRVRFAINTETAKRAGLVLSSQLMKLAILINETPP